MTDITELRIISYRDVLELVCLSRSTITRLIRDYKFPQPVRLGGTRVGFVETEVKQWLEDRLNNRTKEIPAVWTNDGQNRTTNSYKVIEAPRLEDWAMTSRDIEAAVMGLF